MAQASTGDGAVGVLPGDPPPTGLALVDSFVIRSPIRSLWLPFSGQIPPVL